MFLYFDQFRLRYSKERLEEQIKKSDQQIEGYK